VERLEVRLGSERDSRTILRTLAGALEDSFGRGEVRRLRRTADERLAQ